MRAIVIGAGHNGLAAAFYLAKAGLQTVVFEARGEVGGGAITSELHAGFRCPTLTHEVLLHERVARDMALKSHGLQFVDSDVERSVLRHDAPPLVIYRDAARTATELGRHSANDLEAFLSFRTTVRRHAAVLSPLLEAAPPHIDRVHAAEALMLLTAARRFRSLSKSDAHRLLRWISTPVADVLDDMFENASLKAGIAAPALIGSRLGPRAGGTTLLLLLREAHRQLAAGGGGVPIGGPGAVPSAMAAAAAAAGARVQTAAPVERIIVESGRVRGVVARGREHLASIVVSAIDPKTTCWLAGLADGDDDFARAVRHYRLKGTLAKVNLALSGMPAFEWVGDRPLGGRLQIGATLDALERAADATKYGEISTEPWLDIAIPSVRDRSLAPPGAHVASIYVHHVPRDLRSDDWDTAADDVLGIVMRTLEDYAPRVSSQVVAAQVITPRALQREYGFGGGHVFHGELALDQLFGMRPVFGYSRYGTPIGGLFLCGAGTHPGGFMTGTSGRLAAKAVQNASMGQ
jgi:phytoene dehydrogenase-like protein